ncbi:hypothetical protein B0H12DRAFT_1104789 [Mycena haematopus]|nr:hypothetical protein B0H12DRAFT_1104789 [Mycena haematopus]
MEFISSPFPRFCLQLSSNMYVLGFFGTFGAFRVAAIGFQVCQALCEKNSGDWVRWRYAVKLRKVFPGRVCRGHKDFCWNTT